ncbi:MAG: hypothetical protein ACRDWA_11860 [Acidimicrobiia bacterium]
MSSAGEDVLEGYDFETWGTFEHPAIVGPDLEEFLIVGPPYPQVPEARVPAEGYRVTMRFDPDSGNSQFGWVFVGMKGEVLDGG